MTMNADSDELIPENSSSNCDSRCRSRILNPKASCRDCSRDMVNFATERIAGRETVTPSFRRGHYANAIALADREPRLLDFCSLLLIPECDSLESFAAPGGQSSLPGQSGLGRWGTRRLPAGFNCRRKPDAAPSLEPGASTVAESTGRDAQPC